MFSKYKPLILAALTVIAVTTSAAPSTAASFRIERQGAIESRSLGLLTFGEGSITIQCEVTLNGSVSSALLNKVANTQFGSITQVRINEAGCRGGTLGSGDILGLPWKLRYQSIFGTLPNGVTHIVLSIERAAFNLPVFGGFVDCLYAGNPEAIMVVSGTNPYTSGLVVASPTLLRLVRGNFGCPSQGSMNGVFALRPTLTITRL